MSRPHAWVELRVWALMAVPTGVLAGGVAGVLVNAVFAGAAPVWALGLAVALVTGAGPLANTFSVVWSHWSAGRDKIRALATLQSAFAGCLALVALAPVSVPGLVLLVAAVLGAGLLWCGIVTIRGSIWRANYERAARTAFAARSQVLVSIVMALSGAAAGYALDLSPASFRAVFALAALAAVGGLVNIRRLRVRRHRQLLAAESEQTGTEGFRLGAYLGILREDPLYRRYLICMMLLGGGNLMVTAPLILVLTRNLGVPELAQVLITASLPMLLVPLSVAFWARRLAAMHVIAFRALNSRMFVTAHALMCTGAVLAYTPVIWLGAVVLGLGMGGGSLGWNLGHNDFAPPARVPEYLGLHVTLTGLRGLVAPLVGVGLYSALEHVQPGAGPYTLVVPLVLSATGSIGFNVMRRSIPDPAKATT